MGEMIMKEAPDVDFYVGWSSVVDAPTFAGTREEVLAKLVGEADPWLREDAPHHPERRLERVDQTGTSSVWVSKMNEESPTFAAHGHVDDGCWEDDGKIYKQEGFCRRANIFVLTRRLMEDRDADLSDLLEPFDDDAA